MPLHLAPRTAAAAIVLAGFGGLAWSLGARTFLRDLAVGLVGAFPLTVAAALVFVLVQLLRLQTAGSGGGFIGSAGIGGVSVGLEESALQFAVVVLIEMLALRIVPLKAALWAIAAAALAETAFVAWALIYFRPTIER